MELVEPQNGGNRQDAEQAIGKPATDPVSQHRSQDRPHNRPRCGEDLSIFPGIFENRRLKPFSGSRKCRQRNLADHLITCCDFRFILHDILCQLSCPGHGPLR